MGAEDVAEGFVEEMGGGVVALDGNATAFVDFGFIGLVEMLGKFVDYVDDEVVFFFGVDDGHHVASGIGKGALVAYLTAAFAIEGSAVEDKLEEFFVFDFNVTVAGDADFG